MTWNEISTVTVLTLLLFRTLKVLSSNRLFACVAQATWYLASKKKNSVYLPSLDHSFLSSNNISSIAALWLTELKIYCHFQLPFSLYLTHSPTANHACSLFTVSLLCLPLSSQPSTSLLIHLRILLADGSACLLFHFLFIHWQVFESLKSCSFYHVAFYPDIL